VSLGEYRQSVVVGEEEVRVDEERGDRFGDPLGEHVRIGQVGRQLEDDIQVLVVLDVGRGRQNKV
jgi:hypothetical protein